MTRILTRRLGYATSLNDWPLGRNASLQADPEGLAHVQLLLQVVSHLGVGVLHGGQIGVTSLASLSTLSTCARMLKSRGL